MGGWGDTEVAHSNDPIKPLSLKSLTLTHSLSLCHFPCFLLNASKTSLIHVTPILPHATHKVLLYLPHTVLLYLLSMHIYVCVYIYIHVSLFFFP